MISPKVIDVEGNRVWTDEIEILKYRYDCFKRNSKNYIGSDPLIVENTALKMNNNLEKCVVKEGGRFPTQLFTNINEDKYKYVKYVDTKN